jgi:hypothetical protein
MNGANRGQDRKDNPYERFEQPPGNFYVHTHGALFPCVVMVKFFDNKKFRKKSPKRQ